MFHFTVMSGFLAWKSAISSSIAFLGAGSDWSELITSSPASAVEAVRAKLKASPVRPLKTVMLFLPLAAATMAAAGLHVPGYCCFRFACMA